MAESSQFATALINETVNTFNGGAETVSAVDGISLIENWISALHSGDESTNPIAHTLSELRVELSNNTPNPEQVQSLLEELTNQTHDMALLVDGGEKMSLVELATALKGFGERLAGQRPGDGSAGATVAPSTGSASANPDTDELGASGADKQDGGPYNSGYGGGDQ